jgi:hypothetical protein
MENKLDDDLEMCSNCFDDEEYDFGLCITCVEEAFAEIEEMQTQKPLTLVQVSGNLLHSATQQPKE